MVWDYMYICLCIYMYVYAPTTESASPIPQRYGRNCQVPKGQPSITTGRAGMDGWMGS